jgi:hypothetical protein
MTRSSRGVSVFRRASVCSLRFRLMTFSAGETAERSSMKSPRCESSSSPIGVSSDSPASVVSLHPEAMTRL